MTGDRVAVRGLTVTRWSWMLLGTTAALVAILVLILAAWIGQRRLIYFPQTGAPVPPAGEVLPGARDVVLHTADGLDLGAWYVPASGDDLRTAVLVANGNAGDRSMRAPLAAALARAGLSVLLFDYRGYAGNPGTPSEEGLALDVRAALAYLEHETRAPSHRILYYGESLGAAVITELAAEHPPAGLLLRSPFTDLAAVGRAHYPLLPVGLLLRERYPLVEHLRSLAVPTSVVYGSADRIVRPEQSRATAAAARRLVRLVEVPGADHNDRELLDGPQLVRAALELADRVPPR